MKEHGRLPRPWLPRPQGASTLRTTSHYPLLFLHERTSAAGKRYIVVVRRRPRGEWELLNGRLYTPYFYMMIEPGSRGATLNSLWGARKSEPTFGPAAQSLAAKTASQEAPSPQGHMRLFMGYRDPKDPSLFFLPYEIDGVPGRVKVRLTDRGTAIDLSFNEP